MGQLSLFFHLFLSLLGTVKKISVASGIQNKIFGVEGKETFTIPPPRPYKKHLYSDFFTANITNLSLLFSSHHHSPQKSFHLMTGLSSGPSKTFFHNNGSPKSTKT